MSTSQNDLPLGDGSNGTKETVGDSESLLQEQEQVNMNNDENTIDSEMNDNDNDNNNDNDENDKNGNGNDDDDDLVDDIPDEDQDGDSDKGDEEEKGPLVPGLAPVPREERPGKEEEKKIIEKLIDDFYSPSSYTVVALPSAWIRQWLNYVGNDEDDDESDSESDEDKDSDKEQLYKEDGVFGETADASMEEEKKEKVSKKKKVKPERPPPGEIDMDLITEKDTLLNDGSYCLKEDLKFDEDYQGVYPSLYEKFAAWYGVKGVAITGTATPKKEYNWKTYKYETITYYSFGVTRLIVHRASDLEKTVVVVGTSSTKLSEILEKAKKAFGIASDTTAELYEWSNTRYYARKCSWLTDTLSYAKIEDREDMIIRVKDPETLEWDKCDKIYTYSYSGSGYSSYYTVAKLERPGCCGLGNQGNTCYMNSALQCLSHCRPLVCYLLSGKWKEEINTQNPISSKGAVVTAYAGVVESMWRGKSSYFTPSAFKQAIGKQNALFAGYGQQDSHELLSFLMDGIHEDLNRILKKPYVPDETYEGQSPEEWAARCWERYKLRNDSIMVDLFGGQFLTHLRCTECNTEVLACDPFMAIPVHIPMPKFVKLQFVLHTQKPFASYNVTMRVKKVDSIQSALEPLSDPENVKTFGTTIRPERLCITSTYRGSIDKIYKGNQCVSKFTWGDYHVYQLLEQDEFVDMFVTQSHEVTSYYYKTTEREKFGTPTVLSFARETTYFKTVLELVSVLKDCFNKEALSEFLAPIIKERKAKIEQSKEDKNKPKEDTEMEEKTETVEQTKAKDSTMDVDATEKETEGLVDGPNDDDDDWGTGGNGDEGGDADSGCYGFDEPEQKTKAEPNSSEQEEDDDDDDDDDDDLGFVVPTLPEEEYGEDIFTGIKNIDLLLCLDRLFTLRYLQATQYSYYHRTEELLVDNGDSPIKLNGTKVLCIEWTSEAEKAKLFDQDVFTKAKDVMVGCCEEDFEEKKTDLTLEKCLADMEEEELLTGQNMWRCHVCKEERETRKDSRIWKAPPLLVFQLKRFYTSDGLYAEKITDFVKYPVDGLDMTRFIMSGKTTVEGKEGPFIYDLYAVSEQSGTLTGGHYTAYARVGSDWYDFNDSSVSKVTDTSCIVSQNAYVLMYILRGWDYNTYSIDLDNLDKESTEEKKETTKKDESDDDEKEGIDDNDDSDNADDQELNNDNGNAGDSQDEQQSSDKEKNDEDKEMKDDDEADDSNKEHTD